MKIVPLFFVPFLFSGLCCAGPDIAQLLSQLQGVHSFSQPSISPDGRWVTWNEKLESDRASEKTYLLDRSKPVIAPRVIPGEHISSVAWSPDSRHIAFLADESARQRQLFSMEVPDGKPRQLTNVKGYLTAAEWLPDGKAISVLFAEGGGGGGPLEAEPAALGVIGGTIHNQRLSLINPDGGTLRPISPADLNVYEYDFAPDGDRFTAVAAPGPADNNWWIAKLYLGQVETGEMKVMYNPPAEQQIALPRWSPDGRSVAFIGGLMSDEGFIGGDVLLMEAIGEAPRNLTGGSRNSPSSIRWIGKDSLLITAAHDGGGEIATIDLTSGKEQPILQMQQTVHEDGNYPNLALSRDGKAGIFIKSDWQHAPEVWAGAVGDWKQITRVNANQKAHWGKAESITWSNGAFQPQGWLLYPADFDSLKHYPMIVSVHGGPAGMRSPGWPDTHFDMSAMAALGYFVFFPNARGSYGGGEEFTRANIKDFGHGDLSDILTGIDSVLKKVPVASDRIGITGWSYGGYMTMWTVTQTNRFRAAVAGAGIANWLSYYGENSIDEWMIPYFGASVYDDPAVYAKSSPIGFIKKVKTPTLVLVGERDGECPPPQSFEFWHALQSLHVPSELVVYPGEGHAFRDPADNLDRMRRSLEWFDKYLGKP